VKANRMVRRLDIRTEKTSESIRVGCVKVTTMQRRLDGSAETSERE